MSYNGCSSIAGIVDPVTDDQVSIQAVSNQPSLKPQVLLHRWACWRITPYLQGKIGVV